MTARCASTFRLLFFLLAGWLFFSCQQEPQNTEKAAIEPISTSEDELPTRKFKGNLCPKLPDTLPFLAPSPRFLTALYYQEKYLMRNSTPRIPTYGFSKREMLTVVRKLKEMPILPLSDLCHHFDFYQLETSSRDNRVRVTGYYTPRLEASRQRTEIFNYPLLRKPPEGFRLPNIATLRGRALPDSLTAIAWVKSEKEAENAQLQGSCLLKFGKGKQQFLGFGGSAPMPGGGKYVFFKEVDEQVLGAGSFPMTAGYSLALDPHVAPIGSTVFAELPRLSPSGQLLGYTYRILFVQDRGGAIKTTKRVDLYSGIGQEGLKAARKINQMGRFWVLLPKR